MITCDIEWLHEESWIVSCEVLEELSGHYHLPSHLSPTLRHNSLCKFHKVVLNFFLPHFLGNPEEHVPVHVVSAHILNRIMKTLSWNIPLRLNKSIKFLAFRGASIDDNLPIQGINDWNSFLVGYLLAIKEVNHAMRFGAIEGVGIDSSPFGDIGKPVFES